jgi:hypothetical protein
VLILAVNRGDVVRVGRDIVISFVGLHRTSKIGFDCDPGQQVTRNATPEAHLAAQLEREQRLGLEPCETCLEAPPARARPGG